MTFSSPVLLYCFLSLSSSISSVSPASPIVSHTEWYNFFVPVIVTQNILAFLAAAIQKICFRSAYPFCYCPSGTYYKSHGFFRHSRSRIIWNMTSLNSSSNWENKGRKNVHWSLLNTCLMLTHATSNVCDIIWKFLFVVTFLVHNASVYLSLHSFCIPGGNVSLVTKVFFSLDSSAYSLWV